MSARKPAAGGAAGPMPTVAVTPSSSSSSRAAPQRFVSPAAHQRNVETVAWARGMVALAGAAVCGIAGVTGTYGFAAYLLQHVVVSLCLLLRMSFRPGEYLASSSPLSFVLGGITENLVMWALVWSFAYAVCHLYATG
jgi:hypothetical protein